jgi:hypothetical protein
LTPGWRESVVTAAVMLTSTVFGNLEMLTRTPGLVPSPGRDGERGAGRITSDVDVL